MDNDCPLLRELDAWFSLALDVLATDHAVRRDVLLLLGGAGRVEDVAHVTSGDCEAISEHLLVYPPGAGGRSLPLTPAFVEVTELTPADWPDDRPDPAADAKAVEDAIATVDGALARLTGVVREGGADRLRALRMHAWRHELGDHVAVLARCYGGELTHLLERSGTCTATRTANDVGDLLPRQREKAPAVA